MCIVNQVSEATYICVKCFEDQFDDPVEKIPRRHQEMEHLRRKFRSLRRDQISLPNELTKPTSVLQKRQ